MQMEFEKSLPDTFFMIFKIWFFMMIIIENSNIEVFHLYRQYGV